MLKGNHRPEFVYGPGGDFSQQRLELGKGHLDRIEVRRVWRHEQEMRTYLLDHLAHVADFMGRQVADCDDVAGTKLGREDLLGIGLDGGAVHGTMEQRWWRHAAQAQTGGTGGLAMTVRDGRPAGLTAPLDHESTAHFHLTKQSPLTALKRPQRSIPSQKYWPLVSVGFIRPFCILRCNEGVNAHR